MGTWINSYIRELPHRSRAKDESSLIRLDRNESSFEPAPGVVKAIRDSAAGVNRYPDSGAPVLTAGIAKYVGCSEANVVVGNGSDEIIELLSRALLSSGDEIIVPLPTFFYYSTAARAVGGKVIGVQRNSDFSIKVDGIEEAVTSRTKIIYIANPNNPTGTLEDLEAIENVLAKRLPALIVVDECYFEYSGASVVEWLPRYENLFVMRSFSKGFGLAGLRVGYGIGLPQLCECLYKVAQSYSVNRLAQVAACAALEDVAYAKRKIADICRERERLADALGKRGVAVYPSAANFLVADLTAQLLNSEVLVGKLNARGIAVADFGRAEGLNEHCVRITIGTPDENDRCLAAMDEVLSA